MAEEKRMRDAPHRHDLGNLLHRAEQEPLKQFIQDGRALGAWRRTKKCDEAGALKVCHVCRAWFRPDCRSHVEDLADLVPKTWKPPTLKCCDACHRFVKVKRWKHLEAVGLHLPEIAGLIWGLHRRLELASTDFAQSLSQMDGILQYFEDLNPDDLERPISRLEFEKKVRHCLRKASRAEDELEVVLFDINTQLPNSICRSHQHKIVREELKRLGRLRIVQYSRRLKVNLALANRHDRSLS